MTDTRTYRHTVTGKIVTLTDDQASVFPEYLQPVADDAKPLAPGMFKPGPIQEFEATEPLTDAQTEAQAHYDALLENNAPNSRIVRDAKAQLDAVNEAAEKARLAAEKEAEDAEAERQRLALAEAQAEAAAEAQTTPESGTNSDSEGSN